MSNHAKCCRLLTILFTSIFTLYFISLIIKNCKISSDNGESLSWANNFLFAINSSENAQDQNTSTDDLSIVCFDVGLNLNWEKTLPLSPFIRAPPINSTALKRMPHRYSPWTSSAPLVRILTPCEHSLLMRLLIILEHILRRHEITFFIAYGTLIGSWRHHDVIPWDADADLMISIHDKFRFLDILKSLNSNLIQFNIFHSLQSPNSFFKLSFKISPSAGNRAWRFPFVDIFFYQSNNTHIWVNHLGLTVIDKTNVFPLRLRPLGQLWLPAPRHPKHIIPPNAEDICSKKPWHHRTESPGPRYVLNCSDLRNVYAFVRRNNTHEPIEVLERNNTIIHTVIYQ